MSSYDSSHLGAGDRRTDSPSVGARNMHKLLFFLQYLNAQHRTGYKNSMARFVMWYSWYNLKKNKTDFCPSGHAVIPMILQSMIRQGYIWNTIKKISTLVHLIAVKPKPFKKDTQPYTISQKKKKKLWKCSFTVEVQHSEIKMQKANKSKYWVGIYSVNNFFFT